MSQQEYTFEELPNPGDAFYFRVSKDLYGACRMIRRCTTKEMAWHGCPTILCAVSTWRGKDVPDPADAVIREIATCTVVEGKDEREELQLLWIKTPPPPEYTHFGTIKPTAAEAEMECFAFADWRSFLWTGGRDSGEHTADLRVDKSPTSYTKVIEDAKISDWTGTVSEDAADEVRELLRHTIMEVANFQGEDRRGAAIAAVQECIGKLNEIDSQHGPFICTIEREDLCNVFCNLLELAGVDSPEEFIDQQRDW